MKERLSGYRKEYLKKYMKEYRIKNAKYWKEYYEKNSEHWKEQAKENRIKNKEKIKERDKGYYEKNKERYKGHRERYKKLGIKYEGYYEKNKEKYKERAKEYRRSDMGRAANTNMNNKRRAKYKQTDITTKYLKELFSNTKICEVCNKKMKRQSVDHIIPLNVGGLHIKSNIRVICLRCNMCRPKDGSDIQQLRLAI